MVFLIQHRTQLQSCRTSAATFTSSSQKSSPCGGSENSNYTCSFRGGGGPSTTKNTSASDKDHRAENKTLNCTNTEHRCLLCKINKPDVGQRGCLCEGPTLQLAFSLCRALRLKAASLLSADHHHVQQGWINRSKLLWSPIKWITWSANSAAECQNFRHVH